MPEGPSLVIAVEELQPFVGRTITAVTGNSKQDIQRLKGQTIRAIFSFGKYLNFQFDDFALRIHFMLFGSFRVDEEREGRTPRLTLTVGAEPPARGRGTVGAGTRPARGHGKTAPLQEEHTAYFYACSVQFHETADIRATYDLRTDIMSPLWDRALIMRKIKALPAATTVDDMLMDQAIFTGVGNIIKNEVLWRRRLHPSTPLSALTGRQVGQLVDEARAYSFQFYEWKKQYVLRKNYQIYRKGACPRGCAAKVTHRKTGARERMSHWCPVCQPEPAAAKQAAGAGG